MKSMTIHGIDKQLEDLIRSKAESEGLSINKTIKKLLETSLGIKPQPEQKNLHEFSEFCGVWSKEDLESFNEQISDMRTALCQHGCLDSLPRNRNRFCNSPLCPAIQENFRYTALE